MIPLRDCTPSRKKPWATYLLIIINLFVFSLEFFSLDPEVLINRYALIPNQVVFTQLKTLFPFLTSLFLHAGITHLVTNMWFLKIFGDNVEELFGSLKFLLFYLFCGLMAGLVQWFFVQQSMIPMLGASGAVAGVLGAYLVFFPHHRIETLIPVWGFWRLVELPASLMLIYWFATQLFAGVGSLLAAPAMIGGIAFWAHAGGFFTGWLAARIVPNKQGNTQEWG
jgi:membrane associated rhomboid family serine protease